jgi:inosose dehydratase
MSIRIGANPIIWSNDDLRELGADISLESCLQQARAIGFEGMELGHKFPREPAALRDVLGRFGLACVSGWYSAELLRRDVTAELSCLQGHLELLKALRSPVLVFAEVSGAVHGDQRRPLSARPRLASGDWQLLGRRISEVAQFTAAAGVQLVYHHHMGTVVQSEQDVDSLMNATTADVGLLLDTGHATFAGIDPVVMARRYASRIRHVHTKDVRQPVLQRALREDWSFLHAVVEGVFTVPGDGSVPFARVLRELRGYAGWIVLEAEQDPQKADPATYAARGYQELCRLIAEELA